jgi:hypothetical protein
MVNKHSNLYDIQKEYNYFELYQDLENYAQSEVVLCYVIKIALDYNLEDLAMYHKIKFFNKIDK